MFIKNFLLAFISTLIIGSVITISSNSLFLRWLGLEINLLRFIPIIINKITFHNSEAAIKYFITQALASILIVTSIVVNYTSLRHFITNTPYLFLIPALAIKIGMAPLHFWFPQVRILLNWFKCLILFTWQKLAPLFLISYFSINILINIIILSSAVTGALGGFNQNNFKLILTYSSISHSSWIVSLGPFNVNACLLYFTFYSLINSTIILLFSQKGITLTKHIISSKNNPLRSLPIILGVMSLGGLPPFLGFLRKIIALTILIKLFNVFSVIFLISSSLVSLFFYTSMFYKLTLNDSPSHKYKNFTRFNPLLTSMLIFLTLATNLILPIVFTLT